MPRGQRNATTATAPSASNNNNNDNDDKVFLQQSQALIPAEVRMISGCEDDQTSADVLRSSNNGNGLPNPRGRAGGACTNALLELLHQQQQQQQQTPSSSSSNNPKELSFQQVLMNLRSKLAQQGHSQIPQLTSSRPLELDETPFTLIGSPTGARRALLVGINYCGQEGQLRGCHNDVYHMQDYLIQVQGFPPQDILVLIDEHSGGKQYHAPSREKIIRALKHLVAVSEPGDAVFFHYSGHGGLLSPDFNSFKYKQQQQQQQQQKKSILSAMNSFYDQTLIPVDHTRAGQIRDFSLFNHFVQPLRAGVVVTCLFDCCHSGSVLDLPYSYRPTNVGEQRGNYAMSQNMTSMSNLAFLYLLAGGTLPHGGIFDNVTHHLQNTVDGDLEDYQGSMADTLDFDTNNDGDFGGTDAGDYGEGGGDFDGGDDGTLGDATDGLDDVGNDTDGAAGMADTDADYGNVVEGEDVTRDFGTDGGDFADNQFSMDPQQQFFDSSGTGGDEGCGDEGCGDLLEALADCLNDA